MEWVNANLLVQPHGLFRIITLFGSVLVALSSGTNYVGGFDIARFGRNTDPEGFTDIFWCVVLRPGTFQIHDNSRQPMHLSSVLASGYHTRNLTSLVSQEIVRVSPLLFNSCLTYPQWVYIPLALSGVVSSTITAHEFRLLALQSVSSSATWASSKCMTMA